MLKSWLAGCSIATLSLFLMGCSNSDKTVSKLTHYPAYSMQTSNMNQAALRNCANIGGQAVASKNLDGSLMNMCQLPNGSRYNESVMLTQRL